MVRFVCPRSAAVLLLVSLVSAGSASAQEGPSPTLREAAGAAFVPPIRSPQIAVLPDRVESRPRTLVPLYVSFSAFQLLDAHSTSRAIRSGAVEANPLMRGFAGNPAAMLAVKAAGTSGVIYVSEKMWKKNKTAAVIFMIATNSAMAWVVQNNYRAVR